MTTTQTITVLKIEDHGGEGICTACGKEGLRWVSILSDGSRVGGECAKKIMGWKPTAKSHAWVTGLHIIAEGDMSPVQYAVLWSDETGRRGAVSINGVANVSGPLDWCRQEYDRYMN
jgi:hypothetical protein